ncbi:hypothetical protein KP509_34G011900 [Ceratopteris richardii]|uniref:Uncharacterized protein n=1 Tax=Ceratopteris richardii TaxID=49495 RepID=A0A8T2QIU0_CERRI|nr:hypothetical protein KP509_34G011900 [Ceratopteris richardii]
MAQISGRVCFVLVMLLFSCLFLFSFDHPAEASRTLTSVIADPRHTSIFGSPLRKDMGRRLLSTSIDSMHQGKRLITVSSPQQATTNVAEPDYVCANSCR